MQPVRVGVVGVGGMGAYHARTLASFAGVEVVAVADPHGPSAEAVAADVGARPLADPFELASSPHLDGLVIASPDHTHPDLAIAAVQQGTFTLCEKPLATTLAGAQRVLDAEVAAGRQLVQMGFMREYDPAHTQLAAELPSIGRIDYVRAAHRNSGGHPRPLERIVCQSMVHDIHSTRFLTGADIERVAAFASGEFDDGAFRHVLAVCALSTGAHAALEFDDTAYAYDVTVEVIGADGDVLTGGPTRPTRRRDGSVDVHLGTDWFAWFADAYRVQDQAWVDSIRAGVATGPTAWDGVAAQAVVDAITRSLHGSPSGQPVAVEPFERPDLYAAP